jgi:hypothetical protein
MADIEQICDLIDDAVDKHKALDGMEDVITWHGHSDDAMAWRAEDERGDEVLAWIDEHLDMPVTEWQRNVIRQAYSPVATGGLVRPPRNPFWMLEAPPTQYFASPSFEPGEITHCSINGLDITDMVRSVTLDNREATFTPTGIVTAVPEPPSGGDVLSNLRAAYRRIADLDRPERTVVAGPEMAARIEGLGITVIESPLVPEGQVCVINPPAIGPMFSEPISFSFDQDVAAYRLGMRFTQPFSLTYSGVFDAFSEVGKEIDKLMRWVNRSERRKQLHRAYRHRCLARRRRNR